MNKANRTIKGNTFNQRSSIYPYWEYGSEWDDWNAELSPSIVNDPEFGISIEMFNNSGEPVQLLLDQVLFTVFYEAPIQLCSDDHYISLYSELDSDVKAYHWEIPSGLNYDPVDNFPYLVSILTEDSDFGSYTICLEKELYSGDSDKCCTEFDYINCNKGSIGNFIWHDLNANGLQDSNESGLHDKRVYLYNESMQFLKETITEEGFYSFDELDPGSYFVKVEVPGMQPTVSDTGSDNNDSDFFEYLDEMMSGLIQLNAGQHINNLDFGLASKASVAGKVWNDRNANGVLEAEDATIENILIRLYDSTGLVDALVSDQDGSYSFNDLNPGIYQLRFIPGGTYSPSRTAIDNDLEPGIFDVEFELDEIGQHIINGGFYIPSLLGGKLWLDNDFDSDFTQGDQDVSNTEVLLLDCNGNTIDSEITDAEGLFEFNALMPGQYSICVNNQNPDIYIAKEIECKDCFELFDNTQLKGQDFVFNPDSYNLELLMYSDANMDQTYNSSSDGLLESVSVSLVNCFDDSVIESKRSGPDGMIIFSGLLEGEYSLQIDKYDNFVSDNNALSISPDGLIEVDCFTLSGDYSLEFGFRKLAEIGDFVWHDENNNGLQDGAEMGLESIEFVLLDENKQELAVTSSDKDGYYSFEGIYPGNYYVMVFELESLFDLSLLNSGSPDVDSDFYLEGGKIITQEITVDYFDSQNDIDLGLKLSAAMMRYDISGNLWRDSNGDLIRQVEQGLEGLNVELIKCAGGAVAETQTDLNGDFAFENLKQDNYFMRMELPQGYVIAHDNYRTVKSNQTECLFLTDQDIEVKSAFMPLSNIEGWLWLDTEVNGQQDNNENGVAGSRVFLLDDQDNQIAETITDASGIYSFEDILPGIYRFELPDITGSHTPTLQAIGDDSSDSELRFENGRYISEYFEVFDGTAVTEVDMGINLKSAIIGGTVFIDDSRDGIRNGVEKGLGSINISLFEAGGTLLQSTVADVDGIYRFYQVFPGDYFIRFDLPAGYVFAPEGMGSEELFDSDVICCDGETAVFSVSADEVLDGMNAGLVPSRSCVSGLAWYDEDEDGIYKAQVGGLTGNKPSTLLKSNSESPVEGMRVFIYEESGTLYGETATDSEGRYLICDIEAGSYYMVFEILPGYVFSQAHSVSDDLFDSDVVESTGRTESFELQNGEAIYGMNAGIHFDMQMPMTMHGGYSEDEDQSFNSTNTVGRQMRSQSPEESNSNEQISNELRSDEIGLSIGSNKETSQSSSFITAIYPNPNSGSELNVVFGNVDELPEFRIQIMNAAGKILDVIESTDKPMYKSKLLRCELSNYSTGNYILQMISNKGTENHRFVVISP